MRLVPVAHLYKNCNFGGWCRHIASSAVINGEDLLYRCTGHRGKIDTNGQLVPVISEVVNESKD